MQKELAEVEQQEKAKARQGGNKGGKYSELAGLAKQRVADLREKLAEVRAQRDEDRNRLNQLESILSTFKVEYNPNFNDEGVKRAVKAWEDYIAEQVPDDQVGSDGNLEELLKEEIEGLNWDDFEGGDGESEVCKCMDPPPITATPD